MLRYRLSLASATGIALGMLGAAAARAQTPPLNPPFVEYGAKFSCGPVAADADVVKGTYATSINIHNPAGQATVAFIKKIVVSLPEGTTPPGQIVVKRDTLGPDIAERVDCPLIFSLLHASPKTHVEGFVVIEVKGTAAAALPLDVVGKYSARGAAVAFQTVTYPGRPISK